MSLDNLHHSNDAQRELAQQATALANEIETLLEGKRFEVVTGALFMVLGTGIAHLILHNRTPRWLIRKTRREAATKTKFAIDSAIEGLRNGEITQSGE